MVIMIIIGGKFCASRDLFPLMLKLHQHSIGVISASYNVPFPVRFLSLRFESHVHKAKKSVQLKIVADLAKPGGV